MSKPVPTKARLRTRPSSDKAGGGVRLHHDQILAPSLRAKRSNPGPLAPSRPPWIASSLRFLAMTKEKEAERRKTLFRNHRSLAGCGTAPPSRERQHIFRRSTAALTKGSRRP